METVEVKLRIPREIHAAVKAKAAEEGRTLTMQIIQIIKREQDIEGCPATSK